MPNTRPLGGQIFSWQDEYGRKYKAEDKDPTTNPWWYDPQGTPVQNAAARRRAMVGSSAAMSQAQRTPSWGQKSYLGSTSVINPAPFVPAVSAPKPMTRQNTSAWYGPQDNNAGNPTSFGGLPQSVPLSWTDNPGMAPGTVPPYEITAAQQVAQGQGSGWNSGAPMNLGWGEEPYPTNSGVTSFNPQTSAMNKGVSGSVPGTAPTPSGPAIPSAWSKFDPAWYQQFSQTERQLTPDTRGMTTPDQYYRDVAQAQADLAWGEKFRATYGRAPTEDDWKFRWMQGQGQTPTAGNTAWQNMAMGNPNAPYGGRAPRR